jgi:SAM-dependent methyltransferase
MLSPFGLPDWRSETIEFYDESRGPSTLFVLAQRYIRRAVLYREGLAHIHDDRFGEIARSAAPVLLDALKRAGLVEGLVIDLGCGSGLFAEPLAAEGYDVLGYDVSRPMLSLARRRVPKATFRLGSLHEAPLPRAIAVTGIGETFNYFVRRPLSEAALARLFERIRRALLPGGILLFDMAAPGRVRGGGPVKSHFVEEDWAILVTTEEDPGRRILTRHIVSFRRRGSSYRRSEETHYQRLFEKRRVLALLRAAGFRARALGGYGEIRFPRRLVGYIAASGRF